MVILPLDLEHSMFAGWTESSPPGFISTYFFLPAQDQTVSASSTSTRSPHLFNKKEKNLMMCDICNVAK